MTLYDCGRVNVSGPDNEQRLFCSWCESPKLVPVGDELPFGDESKDESEKENKPC